MEQIGKFVQEAKDQLTKMSSEANITLSRKEIPEWLPVELTSHYDRTDLDYRYCVVKFTELQAAKRDNIPAETMRVWFKEFIRRGWSRLMFDKRFNAVLSIKMFGAVTIDDWINSVPVYAEDEVRVMIKQSIEKMISRGRYLLANKEKFVKLTDEDKQAIDVGLTKDVEFELRNEKFALIDEYKIIRKEELRKIRNKEIEDK